MKTYLDICPHGELAPVCYLCKVLEIERLEAELAEAKKFKIPAFVLSTEKTGLLNFYLKMSYEDGTREWARYNFETELWEPVEGV